MINITPVNTSSRQYHKKKNSIIALTICIYSFCLFLVAAYAYKHPLYNWDMLGYIALVIQKKDKDLTEIHQKTYASVKEAVPENDFVLLTAGNERRKKWAAFPNEFYNTLPFYAIKPLYVEAVNLFYKMGFSLPRSTVLPSVISYIFIGSLLFYWLASWLKILSTLFISLLIMCSGSMISLAQLSTPDSLSAFLLLFSFYFIIEKPSLPWIFSLMALSVLARLDNIIPCAVILSFLFLSGKWQKKVQLKFYLVALFAFIGLYLGITVITLKSFEGWNSLFYPAFIRHLNLSGTEYAGFSLTAYGELLYSRAITALLHSNVTLFFLFLALVLLPSGFRFRKFTFNQQFSFLLGAIIVLRFILFPDLDDRFNMAYYLLFIIIFTRQYKSLLEAGQSNHLSP